ncbi:MAG TPA: DUF2971 domain-containing protein [Dehalococcoidales bacterium]
MSEYVDKSLFVPESEGLPQADQFSKFSKFSTIIPPPMDNTVLLWRYIELARLISMLSDKKLHFARADTFQDRHEGSVTNPMKNALQSQFADRPQIIRDLSEFRKKEMKESVFISCWCMGLEESEAMWKLYCGDKYGVAITAIYKELDSCFTMHKVTMAPVKYINFQKHSFPQDNLLYPFFHKRLAFAHEKEVRIIKWCSDQMQSGEDSKKMTEEERKEHQDEMQRRRELKSKRGMGISLEWDVDKFIRDIVVHPYAPEWYYNVVKQVVQKFTPQLIGKVQWSSMKTEPIY